MNEIAIYNLLVAQSLEKFRDQISHRVCIVDDQIADMSNDLNQKIDQNLFNDSLRDFDTQHIHSLNVNRTL